MSPSGSERDLVIDEASGSYAGLGGELWLLGAPGDGMDKGHLTFASLVEPEALGAPVTLRLLDVSGLARHVETLSFDAQPADTNLLSYEDPYNGVAIFEFDSTGAFTAGRIPVAIGPTYWHTARNTLLAIKALHEQGNCPAKFRMTQPSAVLGGAGADGDTLVLTDGTTTVTLELDNNGVFTAGNFPVPIGGSAAATAATIKEMLDSAFPDNPLFKVSVNPSSTDTLFFEGVTLTETGATFTLTYPLITFETLLQGSTAQLTPTLATMWVASAAEPTVAVATAGGAIPGASPVIADYGFQVPADEVFIDEQFEGPVFAQVVGTDARVRMTFDYYGHGRLKGLESAKQTEQMV